MAEEGDNKSVSGLEMIKKAVDDLYAFRDHYFENFGLDSAKHKDDNVKKELDKTLEVIEKHKDEVTNKAELCMLKGRALNVTSEYSQEANDLLSKAVKLDPKLVDGWIHLGESYWSNKEVDAAKNCFLGALNHSKNKVALRNLSIVSRQLSGGDAEERIKAVEQSVEKAKEAVSMDIMDGTSWLILGNAYLAQFFASNQNPKILKQSMSAYQQAERDPVTNCNPDLHFNRATAFKYQEEYELALTGFARAIALDPSWEECGLMENRLLQYLERVQEMIDTKGKQKGKKLQSLQDIKENDLGAYKGGAYTNPRGKTITLAQSTIAQLKANLNPEIVVAGKVVCSISSEDPVPFTFCMVDKEGTCSSVTIYNIAPGYGVKIGDSVAIPEPFVQDIDVQYKDKKFQFRSIRVDSPVVLVVNGRKLGLDKQAPSYLNTSVLAS